VRVRVLGSGSSGNATLVECLGTRLLIDAGLGPRELADRLVSAGIDPASIDAIVLSHEHGDHARGAASFSKKWGVRIMATTGTYAAVGLGAVTIAGFDTLRPGQAYRVGALIVRTVAVPHDACEPLAFVVEGGGCSFGHATDLGHIDAALVRAFRFCDAVLIESNYDPTLLANGPYPWALKERIFGARGHLSNADVARYLATGLGDSCRHVVLAHLSEKNNHAELVQVAASGGLVRRGRGDVPVTLTDRFGTDWIDVPPPLGLPRSEPALAASAGRQLRLF
jgi:phosphoribosyl 1,2-cyclic phosphodiesterase